MKSSNKNSFFRFSKKLNQLLRRTTFFSVLILPSHRPDVEIKKFKMEELEQSEKKIEINAPLAKLYREENLAGLMEPVTKIWNNKSAPYLIESDEGIINTANKDIQMSGKCTVTSPQNYQLETASLFYNDTEKSIESKEAVYFHNSISSNSDQFKMTGNQLFADLKKNEFRILEGIRAEHQLNQAPAIITAQSATILPEQNISYVERDVKFKSNQLSLDADRLTLFFYDKSEKREGVKKIYLEALNGKKINTEYNKFNILSKGMNVYTSANNEIDKLEAIGNVDALHNNGTEISAEKLILENSQSENPKVTLNGDVIIKSDGKTAKCQEAEYYPQSGNIKLRRLASIETGTELIEGEEIDYSMKDSKINVKKATGKIKKETLGL